MQKRNVLTVCCTFVVVLLLCMTLFACDKKDGDVQNHALNLEEGTFPSALPSNFQGEESATVQQGLQQGASVDEVRQAVFAMYNVANRSRKTADLSLMTQHTNAGEGFMLFQGFELKSGNAWYYQLPTQSPYPLLESMISYTTLAYTLNSETFYFAHLDSTSHPVCKDQDVFPYGTFIRNKNPDAYSFEEYKEHRFFLDDQLELCNMKFSLEMVDETSETSYDLETHVYKVKLVTNCTLDDDTMREWYKQAFNEGNMYAPFNAKCTKRHYYYWIAEFEVWENGYIKFLNYSEKWDSDNSLVNSDAISKFKFFYDEDEIMALVKQDARFTSLDEEQQAEFVSPLSFIEFYSNAPISKQIVLLDWHIILIVFGSVIFAVIVVVVGVEVAVKKGRLPKLAAKRAENKRKRLEKKNQKKGIPQKDKQHGDELPVEEIQETAEEKESSDEE